MYRQYEHVVNTPVHLRPIHVLAVFVQDFVDLSAVRHVWAYLYFIFEGFSSALNSGKKHKEQMMEGRTAWWTVPVFRLALLGALTWIRCDPLRP